MKNKPHAHFWTERIGFLESGERGSKGYHGTTVYALNVCRAWDVPANGVFMIFRHDELYVTRTNKHTGFSWTERNQRSYDMVLAKLEARERALVNYYGRETKHHLDQIELTPAEKRARATAGEHEF